MAVHVATFAGHGGDLMAFLNNRDVIGESQSLQKWVRSLHARIKHSDFDVHALAAPQV
jgi:hypothetical protein